MDKRTMALRPARKGDLAEIVKIYDHARAFMRSYGNQKQWNSSYPGMESARQDLAAGVLYVVEKGGEVIGTFVMMEGPDPTYDFIENGSWRSDTPYGVIHRVASRGSGVLGAALEFSKAFFDHIRMDTHADNAPMRHLLEKNGFSRRGTIYVADGSPRIAYDLLVED